MGIGEEKENVGADGSASSSDAQLMIAARRKPEIRRAAGGSGHSRDNGDGSFSPKHLLDQEGTACDRGRRAFVKKVQFSSVNVHLLRGSDDIKVNVL